MTALAAEILSPATLARIETTCDLLGLHGKGREMVVVLCRLARVEGYAAGIDKGLWIFKAPPKTDNVVDFEKVLRLYEGRPCDSEGPDAA